MFFYDSCICPAFLFKHVDAKFVPIELVFLLIFNFRLFWADSGLNHVSSYNLKTGQVKVRFRQQSSTFFGISIYQV